METAVKQKQIALPASGRQKLRRAILLITFLSFPITFKFLSPYIIIDGASQGIIAGSLLYFAFLFVFSLFFGRAVCGWACPAAAMQEWSASVNDKRVRGGRANWIKYFIWVPWLGIIIALALVAGGFKSVEPLHLIDGLSSSVYDYIIYFMVVGVIVLLSFTIGRRAFCHYGCWMAPFMIIGTRIKNFLRWPSLHLRGPPPPRRVRAHATGVCTMSRPVPKWCRRQLENDVCILCGSV